MVCATRTGRQTFIDETTSDNVVVVIVQSHIRHASLGQSSHVTAENASLVLAIAGGVVGDGIDIDIDVDIDVA